MNPIKVGTEKFVILDAKWNSERQMALVSYIDEKGAKFETEAFGMTPSETRQAVADDATHRLAR